MKTQAPTIGATVTTKTRKEAYYSNYACRPACWFEPGDRGTVAAIECPKVRSSPGGEFFACIDFHKGGHSWRVALNYGDIVTV